MHKIGDDELIYLIRQENEEAKRLLFFRYEKLLGYFLSVIEKTYYEHLEGDDILSVFMNSIDVSLKTYNMEKGIFLMYFKETFKRSLIRENRDLNLFKSERINEVGYNDELLSSSSLRDCKLNEDSTDIEMILKLIEAKDEEAYRVVLLWMQGYQNKEISKILKIERRHVEYVFNTTIKYCRMILKR